MVSTRSIDGASPPEMLMGLDEVDCERFSATSRKQSEISDATPSTDSTGSSSTAYSSPSSDSTHHTTPASDTPISSPEALRVVFPRRGEKKPQQTQNQRRWNLNSQTRRGLASSNTTQQSRNSNNNLGYGFQGSSRSGRSGPFTDNDEQDFEVTDDEGEMMGDDFGEIGESPFVTAPPAQTMTPSSDSIKASASPETNTSVPLTPQAQALNQGPETSTERRGSPASSPSQRQSSPGAHFTMDHNRLELKLAEQERQDAERAATQANRSLEGSLDRVTPTISNRYDIHANTASNVSVYDDASSVVTGHSMETAQIRNTNSARRLMDEFSVATGHSAETARIGNRNVPFLFGSPGRRVSSLLPNQSVASTASPDPLHPSGHSITEGHNRRRSTMHTGTPMLMPMDEQGHTMSAEELGEFWRRAGKCPHCGTVATHAKIKYGPFGVFRRMEPLTREGQVFMGYCLACHDVMSLRRLLNDPDIPDQLLRHDGTLTAPEEPAAGIMVLDGPGGLESHADLAAKKRRQSTLAVRVCQNWKVQGLCFILLLGSVVGGIFAAISFSEEAEPFVPPPPTQPPTAAPSTASPTMAPTSLQWVWSAEIVGDVDTFGYEVDMNVAATRIAIAAPKAHGGRGQVEVYERVHGESNSTIPTSVDELEEWVRVGGAILGDAPGDDASLGMDLSGDGEHLAVGYPGNGDGFVRVFWFKNDEWKQKGQTLGGTSLYSEFGSSVALNFDGTFLVVGAPQGGAEEQGMFQAYKWTGSSWVNHGAAKYGEHPGDHFATSVSMDDSGQRIAVGVPDDDTQWENAGLAHFFQYVASDPSSSLDGCTFDCWTDIVRTPISGTDEGYRYGHKVQITGEGDAFISSSLSHDDYILTASGTEDFEENVGVVRVVSYDVHMFEGNDIGFGTKGLEANEGFGFDVAIDPSNVWFSATSLNRRGETGVARVYDFEMGDFFQLAGDIGPLPLGGGMWLGTGPNTFGPSTSLANGVVATGFQSVVIHEGEEVEGVVRIHRYQETAAGFLWGR